MALNNTHHILEDLLSDVTCKPGWRFRLLEEDSAVRLVISVTGSDAAQPTNSITVRHYFPAPIATYNERAWRRWVFDCCRNVENHELGEWFRHKGERPFAPLHGPGENPYTVNEFRPEEDRRIRQDGTVREP